MITHLEPDILECEVKWALGGITTNKASGGDGIPVELFQILKDDAVKALLLSMPANLGNSAVATGLEKVSFHSNPKERQCQRMLKLPHNCTHLTRKILQARLQQYMNRELPDVQAGFRKGRGTRDQIANIRGSWKKQESSRKTSISALLTILKPLTVWITINWKILKEMRTPDHLTCLLRNLYVGQEATVRTGHETTDWFQIGKGVRQGCILSPCYLTYIHSTS